MNTTEFNTNDPDIYRATAKVWEAISDPATPEPVRMAVTDEIAHEVTGIIHQLDFRNRAVVTQLYPLVLELAQFALYEPPDDSPATSAKVAPIRASGAESKAA